MRAVKQCEYSRAYCVFDRDGHVNFDAAVRLANQSKFGRGEQLFAITSVPCFEIWILLHYCYSTSAYAANGDISACEQVINDVQRHFPAYAKGHETVFSELANKLAQATTHAARLETHNNASGSSNPSTQLHRLVDYLIKLKQ